MFLGICDEMNFSDCLYLNIKHCTVQQNSHETITVAFFDERGFIIQCFQLRDKIILVWEIVSPNVVGIVDFRF